MATPGSSLAELGEAAVLARVFPRLPPSAATLVGPGDDAAVLAAADGRYVVTTDMMIEGPDFRLAWSTPHDLGWKAAATNLADIAAMGALPTALVVAIAAPPSTDVALLEGIADGLRDACEALAPGCGVVGGDLSSSEILTIAVTAFGDLQGRAPVLRSGARPGDVVAISGEMHLAALGLSLLFSRAVHVDGAPDAARAAALREEFPAEIGAQLAPSPPLRDGVAAALAGATAMLDVSDVLAIDGRRIATASGVQLDLASATLGARVHPGALDSELDRSIDAAFDSGEAHALLATFPADAALPGGFSPIGRVLAGEGLSVDGVAYTARGGWDPYAATEPRAEPS
jgi:thiamine-monophosphate kinase